MMEMHRHYLRVNDDIRGRSNTAPACSCLHRRIARSIERVALAAIRP